MTRMFRNTAVRRSTVSNPWVRSGAMAAITACMMLVECASYAQEGICVRDVVAPDYPPLAEMANLQGSIKVAIEINDQGTVQSAKASGGNPILLREVERNAKQWTFRFLPDEPKSPHGLTVTYVFKLQGEPVDHPRSPMVVFHLPDTVEITAERPKVNVSGK